MVTRSACPAVAIPASTGDVTLFDPPASRDARAIDVVAYVTNVRSQCSEAGERIVTNPIFTVNARRRDAAGAREVLLPMFGADPIKSPRELAALVASPPSTKKVECMSFHPLGSAKMSADAKTGVVKPSGETWSTKNLFVADGSVLPTSIGVNSQLPVMALAMRIARGIAAEFAHHGRIAAA